MNSVHLHGDLKKYGGPYQLDVRTTREAVRALATQLEGFEQDIMSGAFRVVRLRKGVELEVDETLLDVGMSETEVHVYPVIAGAGGEGGLGKILLGVALIGAAIITAGAALPAGAAMFSSAGAFSAAMGGVAFAGITYGMIGAVGVMIAAAGVATMFAPQPTAPDANDREKTNSFIMNGPINVSEQGNVVPVVYGRLIVGSVVVSSELSVDQMLASGQTYDVDNTYGDTGFPNFPNLNNVLNRLT